MKIRLVVTLEAPAGHGDELAAALRARSLESRQEPGCVEFDVVQSPVDPDFVILLELWADQAALDVHHELRATRPAPYAPALEPVSTRRERYEYSVAG